MSQQYRPGDPAFLDFTVVGGTGALVNADSLPTAKVLHNGAIDGAVTVTINAALQTGVYSGSYTIPGGYAVGDDVRVLVQATVGGVASGGVVDRFRLVGYPQTALPNASSSSAGGLLTVGSGAGQVNPSAGAVPVSGTVTLAAATHTGAVVPTVTTVGTVTNPVTAGAVTDKTGYKLDLTQAVPTSNTAQTVGDALNAARAQGFGKWVLSGASLTLYAADGTTVVRTFTLDSGVAPTQRA